MSGTRPTELSEILAAVSVGATSDHYHILPGIVVAAYPATQEADIQIALNDPRFDPVTDERQDEPWVIYPRMRVVWPRFGGLTIMGPLAVGQAVQVFFQDLDDSKFRATGQQCSPQGTRRHGSDGAFCVAWDMTDAGVATDAAAAGSAMIIGKDGDPAQIRISTGTIQLGNVGGDALALASKVETELNNLAAWVLTCLPSMGGTLGPPPGPPYSPGAVKSDLIKAQ